MAASLERYTLVILPEGMATAMDATAYAAFEGYVRNGGRLLVINTPVSTGRKDLTDTRDRTAELCGVTVSGTEIPAFLRITAAAPGLTAPSGRIWAASSRLALGQAEVLATRVDNGAPMLTRHRHGRGEVFFSALGFNPETDPYFASIVRTATEAPIRLDDNRGLRLLETAQTDTLLCISVWGQGEAVLKVDLARLGLPGDSVELREICTGITLAQVDAGRLGRSGVPIAINHANRPYVIAIGPTAAVSRYAGVVSSAAVMAKLGAVTRLVENPETTVEIPPGEGTAVGVYHGGHGRTSEAIIAALKKAEVRAFSLPRLDADALAKCDVLILPQTAGVTFFNQAIDEVREFVRKGGGVMLTHDAVGYRRHKPMFPEIGKGTTNPRHGLARIVAGHPIVAGFAPGDTVEYGFSYDHIAIESGDDGVVVLANPDGQATVVAGTFGSGNVVLNGMLVGEAMDAPGSTSSRSKEPAGTELQLLLNTIHWLAPQPR
jgi:hypothetical protein